MTTAGFTKWNQILLTETSIRLYHGPADPVKPAPSPCPSLATMSLPNGSAILSPWPHDQGADHLESGRATPRDGAVESVGGTVAGARCCQTSRHVATALPPLIGRVPSRRTGRPR